MTPRMWFAGIVTPQSTEEIAVQNEIALVQQNNQAFVSSRELAVKFGKQHKDVLRIIHGYLDSENMNDFNERNFALNEHIQVGRAKRGRPRLADVLMTRDGFALLAKQDQLAERIDLLEGNKKAKLLKLIKDDPDKPL